MKRRIILVMLLLAACALPFVVRWWGADPSAPRFLPSRAPSVVPPYAACAFTFAAVDPFAGGKTWITTWSGTNDFHAFLFDIPRGKILGELVNATPVCMDHDQSRVLCVQRSRPPRWLRGQITRWIERVSRRRIRFPRPNDNVSRFWMVDLNRNSASAIGEMPSSFAADSFLASPDFRHCAAGSAAGREFYLCDLEQGGLKYIGVAGWPAGWWDNRNILIRDPNDNLILYDVVAGKTSGLVSAARLTRFLEDRKIWDESPAAMSVWCEWNGSRTVFYLADGRKRMQGGTSFLIEVERPDGSLTLVNREFKFDWDGRFDRAGAHYVFSGRLPGQGISGVYLRDIASGTNRMLVPPDQDRAFTHPRFYDGSVIYLKSNGVWQVDLNGSNNTRLFPPP